MKTLSVGRKQSPRAQEERGNPREEREGQALALEPSLGAKVRLVMLTPAKDGVSRTGLGPNRRRLTEARRGSSLWGEGGKPSREAMERTQHEISF